MASQEEKIYYILEILSEVEPHLDSEDAQRGYDLAIKLTRAAVYSICCEEEGEDDQPNDAD